MTTKVICYHWPDNTILIAIPGERTLVEFMGAGRPGLDVERETAKFVAVGRDATVTRAFFEGLRSGGLSEAVALDLIAARDMKEGAIGYDIMERADLPATHGYFKGWRDPATESRADARNRRAWEWSPAGLVCNMSKARRHHMMWIRRARDAELANLDVPYMRAVEAGDILEQQRIARQKQTLRDIPQTFNLEGYPTPEDLKAAWPAELPARSL